MVDLSRVNNDLNNLLASTGIGSRLAQIAVGVAQNRQKQAHRKLAALLQRGSGHLASGGFGRSLGFHRTQADQQLPDKVAHVRVPIV